mgnify:CR=1 FL=1
MDNLSLTKKIENGEVDIRSLSDAEKIKAGVCPACTNKLMFMEGCKLCYNCGWSACDG